MLEDRQLSGCLVEIPITGNHQVLHRQTVQYLECSLPGFEGRSSNPHVSVLLLGHQSARTMFEVAEVVRGCADALYGSKIEIGGLKTFGFMYYPDLPRILALNVKDCDGALFYFRSLLIRELGGIALPRNDPFNPHLTLGGYPSPEVAQDFANSEEEVVDRLGGTKLNLGLSKVRVFGRSSSSRIIQVRRERVYPNHVRFEDVYRRPLSRLNGYSR